jgi:hypothetical protein
LDKPSLCVAVLFSLDVDDFSEKRKPLADVFWTGRIPEPPISLLKGGVHNGRKIFEVYPNLFAESLMICLM